MFPLLLQTLFVVDVLRSCGETTTLDDHLTSLDSSDLLERLEVRPDSRDYHRVASTKVHTLFVVVVFGMCDFS